MIYTRAQTRQSFSKADEGSSLVETALTLSILLSVIFGIIECSRLLYTDHYVAYASRDAARYAMVRGSSWSGIACSNSTTLDCDASSTDVQNYVRSLVPLGINSSNVVATTVWTGTSPSGGLCLNLQGNNSPGCAVQVVVTYNFAFSLPYLPSRPFNLSSTAAVIIAQ